MKVGDIVRLRSGGPRMTVEKEGAKGFWTCVWWDPAKSEYKRDGFPEALLEEWKDD